MSRLALCAEAVHRGLAQRRVGSPVAVRIFAHETIDHGRLESTLVQAADLAGRCFASRPVRLVAAGSIESGQVTVHLAYAEGQSALVSVGSPGATGPRVDALIVGAKGILSWEDAEDVSVGQSELPAAMPPPSDDARLLAKAIGESLRTGAALDLRSSQALDALQAVPSDRADGLSSRSTNITPIKPPWGVLLVAGGHTHQEMYAPLFAADPRCRIVGLVDADNISERRQRLNAELAKTLGVPLLANLAEALARDDVHIVSICAEPERRGALIVRCVQARKHLYLDKPLAASLDDCRAIVAAAHQAGVVHQMFSLVRTSPAARLRRLIEAKQLGDLVAIHCDLFFAKGPGGNARLGKPRRETERPARFETIEAKREFCNVGVYPIVLLRWLLGDVVQQVHATTGNYFFAEHQAAEMEDFGQALLRCQGGLVATVSAGRTGWRSHPSGGINRVYVVGTRGIACIDATRPSAAVWADEEPWAAPRRHPEDPMGFWSSTMQEVQARVKDALILPPDSANDVKHFLDCIERGAASDVSTQEAADAHRVILAAYRSAAAGRGAVPS